MAARDEFPRGWTLNTVQNGTNVAATITVPAITGVVHVLDSIFAKAANLAAAAAALSVDVRTTAAGVLVLDNLLVVPAGIGQDTLPLGGLNISSSLGGTIVVAFAGGPGVSQWEELTIQGHDI